MSSIRVAYKYILHFFLARNTKGYGVHSPFMFLFVRFILNEKHPFYIFDKIESNRNLLLSNNETVKVVDFGTGLDRVATVKSIAKKSCISKKHGELLFRMVHYYQPSVVLELGTSFGVSTSYLAASSSNIDCYSLEGSPEISHIASQNILNNGLKNIKTIVGNIDTTLPNLLESIHQLDFVFIDANHTSVALLHYFELCLSKITHDTVIVIDDIYWSRDMEFGWDCVKKHKEVSSTIDLYQFGVVFFNKKISKKHYIARI